MRTITSFLLLSVLCGCAQVDRPPPAYAMRDSAGITIVESLDLDVATLPLWTMSAAPALEIGGNSDDPGHQLTQVVNTFRLGDGRIVLGDRVSREVRFFDPDGGHSLSVGGPGGGPGEFSRQLMGLERLGGDTVVASDWPFGTLTRFAPNGELIGTETIGPYLPGLVSRILADGAVLKDVYERRSYGNEIEWWAAYGEEGLFRPQGAIIRHARGAEAGDTIREIWGEEWFKIGRVGEGLTMRPRPFAETTLVSPSREKLFVAETGSAEVEVWSYDGRLERLQRWEGRSVDVTADDRRMVREEIFGAQPQRLPDFERWLAAVPFPESKPPIRAMIAEADGHLWVGLPAEAGSSMDDWLVFDPEGVPTARAELPPGLVPFEIGGDHVLGVWKDQLDVEYVRLYELNR